MRFESRLKRLEKVKGEDYSDVEQWIREGRFFDELSPQEQTRYDQYRQSLGGVDSEKALAHLNNLFNDMPDAPLHFRLAKRTKPPTAEEHARRVQEVQEYLNQKQGSVK